MQTFIGIDFSGDVVQWGEHRVDSNVWICRTAMDGGKVHVTGLFRVQACDGTGLSPFERLVAYLQKSDYAVAGIDAPFSVPREYVPPGGHAAILKLIADLTPNGRPFPTGAQLIAALAPPVAPPGQKTYRQTDKLWSRRGLNVRSTTWNGARGGAPFAAACMTLLHRAGLPMWPWSQQTNGLLAEAYPAAQLLTWGLPSQGYAGDTDACLTTRREIIDALKVRLCLQLDEETEDRLARYPDALDSLVCSIAAIGAGLSRLSDPPVPDADAEGWIAVYPLPFRDKPFVEPPSPPPHDGA